MMWIERLLKKEYDRIRNQNPEIKRRRRGYHAKYERTEKVKAYRAKWRRENPEKVRAYARKYYAADPERKRARGVKYGAEHRKEISAKTRKWKRENPASVAAYEARRRAVKIASPGRGVTGKQCKQILAESLGICAYCNERRPLTMDHIKPLALGGEHDVENIAAVCGPCNSSKSDTPLLLWMARRASRRTLMGEIAA